MSFPQQAGRAQSFVAHGVVVFVCFCLKDRWMSCKMSTEHESGIFNTLGVRWVGELLVKAFLKKLVRLAE